MIYESTRGISEQTHSADIILQGIADDGGLFVPKSLPKLDRHDLEDMLDMDYSQRAKKILALFLTDYAAEEIELCVARAYDSNKFSSRHVAPIYSLSDNIKLLELWHGPTCAFKDMALQILPHLMSMAIQKKAIKEDIVILVATSGDTGKAALEGFKDVKGTHILVFYPKEGVSLIQERQMNTQEGENVYVVGIEGNFDDAQAGVKAIFADADFNRIMKNSGYRLSSANSINWGRLVPQLIYYISSYLDMIEHGDLNWEESFDVVVPTGNFGNILAAYYTKKMGIPIDRLICASNRNNILTDFISTGTYDSNREFFKTASPSMDILISSNLERLLYELVDRNPAKLSKLMLDLKERGVFKLTKDQLKVLKKDFWSGYADDNETLNTIRAIYDEYNYVLDPHTAVAMKVLLDYRKQIDDNKKTLVISTASPYKFIEDVLKAIGDEDSLDSLDDFEMLYKLSSIAGTDIPDPLRDLKDKKILHTTDVSKKDMDNVLVNIFNLDGVNL
mgnify:CR=1 FL=1